jgi:hypothetical protein
MNHMNNVAPQKWPGWSLQSHSFNGEFDVAARERMIKGGQALLTTLNKYSYLLGYSVLEVGPFFNPLFVQLTQGFSKSIGFEKIGISYLENDNNACDWLKQQEDATIINADISQLAGLNFGDYIENHKAFSSIILSQVINYINFKKTITDLSLHLSSDGLLFVNNVVNYGIPDFFSPLRPKSIEETIEIIADHGFIVLEKMLLPPPRQSEGSRLIVVAQKVNSFH